MDYGCTELMGRERITQARHDRRGGRSCSRAFRSLTVALLSIIFSACSGSPSAPDPVSASNALPPSDSSFEGSIVIARPMPVAKPISPTETPRLLGFLPTQFAVVGDWVVIDRTAGTATLMSGATQKLAVPVEGAQSLSPGTYTVLHKQRHPLWYAPDAYFEMRNQPPPPQGDRLRYRRGALGEFAIFLSQDTPIHSGPMWLGEIGGLKLSENDLSRLYYQLETGAVVEVK